MKFESKFGIGEVVALESLAARAQDHPHASRTRRSMPEDFFAEVIAIQFGKDQKPEYICECWLPTGVQRLAFTEDRLIGDPSFDQEAGCYPDECTDTPETADGKRTPARPLNEPGPIQDSEVKTACKVLHYGGEIQHQHLAEALNLMSDMPPILHGEIYWDIGERQLDELLRKPHPWLVVDRLMGFPWNKAQGLNGINLRTPDKVLVSLVPVAGEQTEAESDA